MAEGLISRERKDVVEMGWELDAAGLNISCNHFEASVSGFREFTKICNSGIQDSILLFLIGSHRSTTEIRSKIRPS